MHSSRLNSTTNPDEEGDDMYDDMMTHKESDDDEFWGFKSIWLILVSLIPHFESRGGLLVLETGGSYMRVYTVVMAWFPRETSHQQR